MAITPAVVEKPASSVELDVNVVGNGSVGRVTETLTCPAGEVFRLRVTLSQDGGTSASGDTKGSCTGEPSQWRSRSPPPPGGGFVAGEVAAEVTIDTADRGFWRAASHAHRG